MIRTFVTILALIASAAAAHSQTCPTAPDHSDSIDALIAQVQSAKSQGDARAISSRIWELWTDAPDAAAQALLDRGMARREAWDLLGALEEFDALVAYCPD